MGAQLVSLVVLNWNGGEQTLACIEHALAQTHRPIEVIVIDNGSSDGSCEAIGERYPDVTLIRNPGNRGFAGGMNQGIEASSGQFVVLLNQDAWLDPAFVEYGVNAAADLPDDVGSLGGCVYRLSGTTKTRELTGGPLLLRRTLQLTHDPAPDRPHFTFSPTWCCPMLRRSMLEDIKASCGQYFDAAYFAYGEDVDLALRAQLLGWRSYHCPSMVAWHVQSASTGGGVRIWQKPSRFRRLALRNRLANVIKDLPRPTLISLAPYLIGAEVLAPFYFLVRAPKMLPALAWAWWDTARRLPALLAARRRVQQARRVPADHLAQFLSDW